MTLDIKTMERHVTDLEHGLGLMKRVLADMQEGKEPNFRMINESRYYLVNAATTMGEMTRLV